MLIIPYGTDTPIYHWPVATAAIIVANVVAYIVQMSLPMVPVEDVYSPDNPVRMAYEIKGITQVPGWKPYALSHGEGLHPVQWLTAMIIHADPAHLIGNMLFLWAFGIIVEGKAGPVLFTLLYFAIGIAQHIVEQLLYLGSPGPVSLGASAAIYGLLVLAMFWAPADNNLCLVLIFFYAIPHIPIPIAIFAATYLFFDFGAALFSEFELSTPLLHVMGAAVGFVPAVAMLNFGLVQSDNEDLLYRIRDLLGMKPRQPVIPKKERARLENERAELLDEATKKRELTEKSIATHLSVGNISAAINLMNDFRKRGGDLHWTESQLQMLIRHFNQAKIHDQTIEYINEYLERFQQHATVYRLLAARIWLVDRGYPRRALKLLALIKPESLDPDKRKSWDQLVNRAKADIDAGTLETEL